MTILKFMGRPRQFDENGAVAAAAAVFRQRGYAATSIDHLVDATGVHRGSLYGVFGSKRGLFLRVLDSVGAPEGVAADGLDVLLVALLELAPTDQLIRKRAGDLLCQIDSTPEQLGDRLLTRAGLPNKGDSARAAIE